MQLDPLAAARAAYPGDDMVRYADGRITRDGVDLTPGEIAAAVAAYQPTHDANEAARAAEESANQAARAAFAGTPSEAADAVRGRGNTLPDLKEAVADLVRALKAAGLL